MKKGFDAVNLHGCLSGIIATPAIGENGNWFLGNDDSGVSAKGEIGTAGPQGEKGDQGIQGEKGEKGDKGDDADSSELERLSGEVDTLKQSLKSVQIGTTVTGTTRITSDFANYNVLELNVLATGGGRVCMHIFVDSLLSTNSTYQIGSGSELHGVAATVSISNGGVNIIAVWVNNTNVTSTSTLTVRCKA